MPQDIFSPSLTTAITRSYWRHAATALLSLCGLLTACGSSGPVQLSEDAAIDVDEAVPHLAEHIDQRISVSGIPRQSEGRCSGVHPLSRNDWMLTGDETCLWVSGRTEDVRLLDIRPGLSKKTVTVTGTLVRTDQGIFVLKVDDR
ncbi:hypothetical protein E4T66_13130 [Sinimarinibacterium sp. CAU 1509]|uniref:hypothetical protein n=1 Tax=Sinimarinibacterium sp. CAU 1509 TaxID=2562283 RepID=UPI0010ACDCED|nr:hypothetical protein [Sinimarinibacterium sp. CAU 1509]TJY59336.1 hypothetical protein E4T66_13130 [Sinimarinibacterium sp. CAU 1509]